MTDRPRTFAEACHQLSAALQSVMNALVLVTRMFLPILPVLVRLTAQVVFYVPEKRPYRLVYALVVSGIAAAGITVWIARLLRWI